MLFRSLRENFHRKFTEEQDAPRILLEEMKDPEARAKILKRFDEQVIARDTYVFDDTDLLYLWFHGSGIGDMFDTTVAVTRTLDDKVYAMALYTRGNAARAMHATGAFLQGCRSRVSQRTQNMIDLALKDLAVFKNQKAETSIQLPEDVLLRPSFERANETCTPY